MTRTKELTEAERRIYRLLKKAFRNAAFSAMKRRAAPSEINAATMRIMDHAVKIGWLKSPLKTASQPR